MSSRCGLPARSSGIILATLTLLSCAPAQVRPADQTPDQLRMAMESRSAQEARYLESLAAGVRNEQRNDAWAKDQEAALRASYNADPRLPRGSLRSVDCRSSKCELLLQMGPWRQASAALDQYHAINSWIAASDACGYTLAAAPPPQETAGTARIFLDCAQR